MGNGRCSFPYDHYHVWCMHTQGVVDTAGVPAQQDAGDGGSQLPDHVGDHIAFVSGVLQHLYSKT